MTGLASAIIINGPGSVLNTATVSAHSDDSLATAITVNGAGDIVNSGTVTATTGNGIATALLVNGPGSIVNSGTVTTRTLAGIGGGIANGILVNGAGSIDNSGAVTATSESGLAAALAVNGAGHIVNSGALTVSAASVANGIGVNDAGSIDNSATVTVHSSNSVADGLRIGSGSIVNSGALAVTADVSVARAIAINNSGTVFNSASVTALSGASATLAVFIGGAGTVVNTGALSATAIGSVAFAVQISGSGTVINSGSMVAAGLSTATTAIDLLGANSAVVNSGLISSSGVAIRMGANSLLSLFAGSTIAGTFNIGAGSTVNIQGGNHNLTIPGLAGMTVTGAVPFVVSGDQVVAVDPTPFAAAGVALTDFSRGVASLMPEVGEGGPPAGSAAAMAFAAHEAAARGQDLFASIPGLSAYAADAAVFKAAPMVRTENGAVWARGFGGERRQDEDGVMVASASRYVGGAIGAEILAQRGLRIGGFIGAGAVRTGFDHNYGSADSDIGFAGVYARFDWGASYLRAGLQGGVSRNTIRRNTNNNLVAGGLETASASYDGWYVSPEIAVGHRFALGEFLGAQNALTPSLRVRYLYGSFDGYTETGSTANMTVSNWSVENVEERFELKLTRTTVLSPSAAMMVYMTGGALAVQRVGGTTVGAALLGHSIPIPVPGQDDVWGGFGGLGGELRGDRVSVFAAGEYLGLSDSSAVISGRGGIRFWF